MIVVKADRTDDGVSYSVWRVGGEPFVSTDSREIVDLLSSMGVDNPAPLVDAALQWGVVEWIEPLARTGWPKVPWPPW